MSALLAVQDLRVYYGRRRHPVKAVDGVTIEVAPGQSVGLVGESGCGKSSLGRAVLRLETIHSGTVRFEGEDIATLRRRDLLRFRRRAQMVYQDPYGSLNARLTIGGAIEEVLHVHRVPTPEGRAERVESLLSSVGLDPTMRHRYPHEFSGGQRQRIVLARALALDPKLLVADEPVSALDVSVQVQILNLMKDLQRARGLAYLFIAHDLAVVRYLCDDVRVMYRGRIVEAAPAESLFARPAHPYTRALLTAVPDVARGLAARRGGKAPEVVRGDAQAHGGWDGGCAFAPRCPLAEKRCRREAPELRTLAAGQEAACHLAFDTGTPSGDGTHPGH